MKTMVEIDSSKLETIQKMYSKLETKEEIVDKALEQLLDTLSRELLRKMRGTGGWDGDLDEMRTYDVPLT